MERGLGSTWVETLSTVFTVCLWLMKLQERINCLTSAQTLQFGSVPSSVYDKLDPEIKNYAENQNLDQFKRRITVKAIL